MKSPAAALKIVEAPKTSRRGSALQRSHWWRGQRERAFTRQRTVRTVSDPGNPEAALLSIRHRVKGGNVGFWELVPK